MADIHGAGIRTSLSFRAFRNWSDVFFNLPIDRQVL